jgi:hypothetical protein
MPKHFTTEVKDISGLTKSISKELGISDIHIQKITRQTVTFETSTFFLSNSLLLSCRQRLSPKDLPETRFLHFLFLM